MFSITIIILIIDNDTFNKDLNVNLSNNRDKLIGYDRASRPYRAPPPPKTIEGGFIFFA